MAELPKDRSLRALGRGNRGTPRSLEAFVFAAPIRSRAVRFPALLLAALLLFGLLPAQPALAADATAESQMRQRINSARTARHRVKLKMNSKMVSVARQHSAKMAGAGQIFHNESLSGDLTGMSWSVAGENVGVGGSIPELHGAFMRSPPHRANVLKRAYNRVGVGVVVASERIWITVVFAG
ncbi:MAG TPA: CAP domain-containing protein [Actinomycetota bacterium]|nr:CAP domain-containing protein [Actinomycetota bacterium]